MPEHELIELLEQKKECVFKLLRLANDTVLEGTDLDADAEKYVALIEERGKIIEVLTDVNDEIERACTGKEIPSAPDALRLKNETQFMLEQLIRLEENFNERAAAIMSHLQKNIKDMNNRKRVSKVYDAMPTDTGNYFDTKSR